MPSAPKTSGDQITTTDSLGPKPLPTETPEQQASQDEAESRLAAEKLADGPTDAELAALEAELAATNAAIEAAKNPPPKVKRPDVKVIPRKSVAGSINGRKFAVTEGVEQTVTAPQADILRAAGVIA